MSQKSLGSTGLERKSVGFERDACIEIYRRLSSAYHKFFFSFKRTIHNHFWSLKTCFGRSTLIWATVIVQKPNFTKIKIVILSVFLCGLFGISLKLSCIYTVKILSFL
uniref:Uncharacterized protein n=1 Tax=Sipha flava TaxID=143950 RepID=A0A2S2R444_9HEMI